VRGGRWSRAKLSTWAERGDSATDGLVMKALRRKHLSGNTGRYFKPKVFHEQAKTLNIRQG
jgi:hypothetical protein